MASKVINNAQKPEALGASSKSPELAMTSSHAATIASTLDGRTNSGGKTLTATGSQDSVLGSWSTISGPNPPLPRNLPTSPPPPIPPIPATLAEYAERLVRSSNLPGSYPVAGPSTFLIPPSKHTPKTRRRRKRTRSTPPPSPPVPRQLIPEPAPPPPSSSIVARHSSRHGTMRLSASSRDRPAFKLPSLSERKSGTPYPNPAVQAIARRTKAQSGRSAVLARSIIFEGGSEAATKGSVRATGRRPSPVPPSLSRSSSTRSSDSYLSLSDDGYGPPVVPIAETAAPNIELAPPVAVEPPKAPKVPRKPSLSQFFATVLAPPQHSAQSLTPNQAPVQGVPRIFHNSAAPSSSLRPTAPANPPQRSPVHSRSPLVSLRPTRGANIIPLPSLTFPSIQIRPRALPPSETAGDAQWTSIHTGMEEYASDHPQDLVERAWLMEERDELERVRHWVEQISDSCMTPEEEDVAVQTALASWDGFLRWEAEKPATLDWAKIYPVIDDVSPVKEVAPVLPLPIAVVLAPTPDISMPEDNAAPGPSNQHRTPSPYPAPPQPEFLLDSSSSSGASPRVAVTYGQKHGSLDVPVDAGNSYFSLASPSPLSGLPSPLRLPAMPTPYTPAYPLGQTTPLTQEPLPPISNPSSVPTALPPAVAAARVPSALEHISSYLSSSASPRPPSPETPPRIIHSSTERHQQGHRSDRHLSRSRSLSSDCSNPQSYVIRRWARSDSGGSTLSAGITRSGRGRSPTRRSWKASSERAVTAARVSVAVRGGGEVGVLAHPVLVDASTGGAVVLYSARSGISGGSWHLSSVHDGVEDRRPRTASRSRASSPSRYTSSAGPRPDTRASINTSELFYHPQVPPNSIDRHGDSPAIPVEASGEILGNPTHDASTISVPQATTLRKRKSHRAPTSVVSLPKSDSHEAIPNAAPRPQESETYVMKSVTAVEVKAPKQLSPSATAFPIVVPPLPGVEVNLAAAQAISPQAGSTLSLAFLKLITLLSQFTSDLSTDRRGVPRWKRDFGETEEKIRMVYDTFRAAIERSQVDFRPWFSSDERSNSNGEAQSDLDRRVMYVDDVWDALGQASSTRGSPPSHTVQEDIIRSVVSSWESLAAECMSTVRAMLENLMNSIVDLHFRCAGDGNELRVLVRSIASAQLQAANSVATEKVQELVTLENTYTFSANDERFRQRSASTLLRYQELFYDRVTGSTYTPEVEQVTAALPTHLRTSNPHRNSLVSTDLSPSASNTIPTATLFSQGPTGSTNLTSSDGAAPRPGSKEELRKHVLQRRQQSLDNSNRSHSTDDAVQSALITLRRLGFDNMTSPEKLYEKLSEPDPVLDVLKVMAHVDAYIDAASTRFVDYVTLHIEHCLVNAIGEKINSAVLGGLDLSGSDIMANCTRWMTSK